MQKQLKELNDVPQIRRPADSYTLCAFCYAEYKFWLEERTPEQLKGRGC
jgi:hypothetical protein